MRCDDLRIGGTLSASGISGGLSINSTALMVSDWAGLLGVPGITATPLVVAGRPGMTLGGDQLGRPRFFVLNLKVTRWGPTNFALTAIDENHQIWANTDNLLTQLSAPETLLEVDLPDGTSRWLRVANLDPALSIRHDRRREFSIPLVSDWPYWRAGGAESSQVVSAATTLTGGGRKNIYDPVLTFSGDGTFTHSDLGWALEVVGSTGPVTVDLGARTVSQGGSPADNLLRRTPSAGQGRVWGWLLATPNNVTSTVSVTVTWRPQWA